MPEPAADAPSTCPRCGGGFRCGIDDAGPCACTTLVLSASLQAALRARYEGCLCLPCLRALSAAGAALHDRPAEAVPGALQAALPGALQAAPPGALQAAPGPASQHRDP